jgi:hypothetical protein
MAKYFASPGSAFQWDKRILDLTPARTKMDDRRLVPICDRLFDILQPLRRDSGPVISLKKARR